MTPGLPSQVFLKYPGVIILILALLGFFAPAANAAEITTVADLEVKFYEDDILLEEPIDGDKATIKVINTGDDELERVWFVVTRDDEVLFSNNLTIGDGDDETLVEDLKLKEGQQLTVMANGIPLSDIEIKKPDELSPLVYIIVIGCIAGLAFAYYLARWVLAQDTGTKKMREI